MAHKMEYHIRDYIENGRDFVLARIVATKGSSPRKEDSIMVMSGGGKFMGTVGGGRIEAETEKKCREVYETKPEEGQIRFITDSAYVLTGELTGDEHDTCLYSGQKNLVEVMKEALKDKITLLSEK